MEKVVGIVGIKVAGNENEMFVLAGQQYIVEEGDGIQFNF